MGRKKLSTKLKRLWIIQLVDFCFEFEVLEKSLDNAQLEGFGGFYSNLMVIGILK